MLARKTHKHSLIKHRVYARQQPGILVIVYTSILLEICYTPFLKERLILGLKLNILNQLRILAPMFLKHPLIKLLVLGVHLLFSIRTNQPDAH